MRQFDNGIMGFASSCRYFDELNRIPTVQECDAEELNSSNSAKVKKKKIT